MELLLLALRSHVLPLHEPRRKGEKCYRDCAPGEQDSKVFADCRFCVENNGPRALDD